MNRAKLLSHSLKLANSLTSSTRRPLTQVTHFSVLTQSPLVSLPKIPQIYGNNNILSNFHKVSFFSTKTETFIDITLSKNNWSKEMENEIEKVGPELTHESIVYVLMNLKKTPQKAFDFFRWVCGTKGFEPNSIIYNLMLRTLVGRNMIDTFWDFAKEMKEKGFIVNEHTYSEINRTLSEENMGNSKRVWGEFYKKWVDEDSVIPVVNQVVEVIKGSEWNEDVESKLKKIEFPLSENFLVPVIGNLNHEPLKALKFFNWVADCRGFEHNAVTYNEMIKFLHRPETVGEFWEVVNVMRGKGYAVAKDTYIKVFKLLPRKDGVALFEDMMDGPYKLEEQVFLLFLRFMSMDDDIDIDIDLVLRVVDKYKAAGNKLTKDVYCNMHRCFCSGGRFDEAEKVIETMVNDIGCVADNTFYDQEVFCLCKLKRLDEARKVLDKMEARGCIPDTKTWSLLVQGYCSADQLDQALLCLGQMKQKNVDPDGYVVELLIKGFLSKNELLGAYAFLSEIVHNSNVKPLHNAYKIMVEKLVEVGKHKEAMDVIHMMKNHNFPPFADPFIEYISKFGSVEDAKEFLREYPVTKQAATRSYLNFFRSFLQGGRVQEARDLLYSSPPNVRHHKDIPQIFGSEMSLPSEAQQQC